MSDYSDDREERDVSTTPDVGVEDRGRALPGLVALALFGVLAWVFARASFGDPAPGFAGDAGITASIGYAMFNIVPGNAVPSEGFLVAFEIIDIVLVAALVGAVMLARREEAGELVTGLRSAAASREQEAVPDGGREEGED